MKNKLTRFIKNNLVAFILIAITIFSSIALLVLVSLCVLVDFNIVSTNIKILIISIHVASLVAVFTWFVIKFTRHGGFSC